MESTPKVGDVGKRVAKEVARLRGRVPVREFSTRLAALGRPILPSGITKIEQGQRRIDVDDLVALAVALEVTPTRLLLGPPPPDIDCEKPELDELCEIGELGVAYLRLLPNLAMEVWDAWTWAVGECPLGEWWKVLEGEPGEIVESPPGLQARFKAENSLPPIRMHIGQAEDVQEAIRDIGNVVQGALDQGLTDDQIEQIVRRATVKWRSDRDVTRENEEKYRRG
ncbi:helix-turn-helix transcriptional regulator [Streptomyces sp. H27-H1]|uniref:helix-turn-helix domain-containing protein n=1 Tax=Streptomyces sp. H27-H1 TaxID=2996461 RepID=UPI00226FBF06|nr:helix-turn-helix transcriptional regulator [Streptomyces sp. H27-H1]MCY0926925.1 helix-turn-helix transcriptional regulator [Streptomyces sp. H27-H1]